MFNFLMLFLGVTKCSLQTDLEDLEKVFKIVGGVPRFVLKHKQDSAKAYIAKAVIDCDLHKLLRSIDDSVFTDEISSALVQPIVDANLKMKDITFVSDYVVDLTWKRREDEILNDSILMVIMSSAGNKKIRRSF